MKKAQMATFGIATVILIIAVSVTWNMIQNQQTQKTEVELFTAHNITCVRITDNCISSITSVKNGTQDITNNFTQCGSGKNLYGLALEPDVAPIDGYAANATYVEKACQQLKGMTQTIVNYLPILMGVAILAGLAFMVKGF